MMHTECLQQLKKDAVKKKKPITCPICRKIVKKEKIVKKRLLAAEAQVETYDPFAIEVLAPTVQVETHDPFAIRVLEPDAQTINMEVKNNQIAI